MKKLLLFLVAIVVGMSASAQDVIVKKDGSTVLCKIVQVSPSEVIYLKWSDLNGPQYIMDSSLVSNINYQDGRQDKLNEQSTNSYAPGIQQSGEAQYNDNALLALDKQRINGEWYKKYKKLKTIGWAVGGSCVGAGLIILIATGAYYDGGYPSCYIPAAVLFVGGIATTTACLIKANQIKQKALMMAFTPMIQKEFNLGKETSLTASIDMIHDNHLKRNTVGLGLQFNF